MVFYKDFVNSHLIIDLLKCIFATDEMSSYDYEIPYATGESTEYVHPNESFPETPGLWTSPGEG